MHKIIHWLTPPFRPIGSAILAGLLSIISTLGTKMAVLLGFADDHWQTIWICSYTAILLYSILASVFILYFQDQLNYFNKAITTFMILVVCSLLLNFILTGITPFKSGYFVWMLVVITLFFLIILSICRTVYGLVKIAEKQDKKLRNEE